MYVLRVKVPKDRLGEAKRWVWRVKQKLDSFLVRPYVDILIGYIESIDKYDKHREYIFISFSFNGLSLAFLYSVLIQGRRKGFECRLYTSREIEEKEIPRRIRELGSKWSMQMLRNEEIEELRSMDVFITFNK